jgi:hypothetical protein
VLGQNDPPTDGMRGMIEGLLGKRRGQPREETAPPWTQLPPSGIGGCSNRKRWVRLLSYGRGARLAASFLVIFLAPIEGLPATSRLGAESFAVPTSCAFRLGLAVGCAAWSANEPSVGNVPEAGAGCDEIVGAGLRSKDCAGAPSEEAAVAVWSVGASL